MLLRRLTLLKTLPLLWLLILPDITTAATLLSKDKISNGGYIICRNQAIIDEYRADELFVAASTIKLLTGLAAINTFGEHYRFTTSFYLDENNVLYVRGSGDPMLTSESLILASHELKKRGLKKVSALVVDGSAFQLEHPRPEGSENSHNPYDAANGGLAVNFNSIAITKYRSGKILSGEPQTPLLPMSMEIGEQLPAGSHRVNPGPFRVSGRTPKTLRYSAELIQAMLTKAGIAVSPLIRSGTVPDRARLLYSHPSIQTVGEMVESCVRFSSNFIANQLALAAGAQRFGAPATWHKARKLLQETAYDGLGIAAKELLIREGSGLSRANRATPAAMLRILSAFSPYREMLRHKYGVSVKSGTLEDVYCYAGYLDSEEGPAMFALMLNQKKNVRDLLLRDVSQNINIRFLKRNRQKRITRQLHANSSPHQPST